MINIKKTLLFLTCLLFVQAAKAVLPIRIETKAFGKDVIFVFYHDKDQIVDLKATGNNVTASINIPSERIYKISFISSTELIISTEDKGVFIHHFPEKNTYKQQF